MALQLPIKAFLHAHELSTRQVSPPTSPILTAEGGSSEYNAKFLTLQNFSSIDVIGQDALHATHTHYFPHGHVNQVTVSTVVPFVSGSINTRELLAVASANNHSSLSCGGR